MPNSSKRSRAISVRVISFTDSRRDRNRARRSAFEALCRSRHRTGNSGIGRGRFRGSDNHRPTAGAGAHGRRRTCIPDRLQHGRLPGRPYASVIPRQRSWSCSPRRFSSRSAGRKRSARKRPQPGVRRAAWKFSLRRRPTRYVGWQLIEDAAAMTPSLVLSTCFDFPRDE